MTLNNLGIVYHARGRIEDAARAYEEALTICRDAVTRNPESYQPYVVMTLNNLGALYRDQNRWEEAGKAYEEALKISRRPRFTGIQSPICPMWPAPSTTSGSFIEIKTAWTMPDKAFEEALAIYRNLSKQAPERFAADVERIQSFLIGPFS